MKVRVVILRRTLTPALSHVVFFFTHNPPRWEMGVLRR